MRHTIHSFGVCGSWLSHHSPYGLDDFMSSIVVFILKAGRDTELDIPLNEVRMINLTFNRVIEAGNVHRDKESQKNNNASWKNPSETWSDFVQLITILIFMQQFSIIKLTHPNCSKCNLHFHNNNTMPHPCLPWHLGSSKHRYTRRVGNSAKNNCVLRVKKTPLKKQQTR